jgi:hypothetical protein
MKSYLETIIHRGIWCEFEENDKIKFYSYEGQQFNIEYKS